MKLLQEWYNKESFRRSFTTIWQYVSLTDSYSDIDMREVCRHEHELTFNPNSITGFSEIGVKPIQNLIINKREVEQDLSTYCAELIKILCEYLHDCYDPKMPHVFYASGGKDSRIIGACLMKLHNEEKLDLGDLQLWCHAPEHPIFLHHFQNMGYEPDMLHVWNEEIADNPNAPDYFRYDDFSRNQNAFSGPIILFDPIKATDRKKYALMGGLYGGELVEYPTNGNPNGYRNSRKTTLGQWLYFMKYPMWHIMDQYASWGDILYPYQDMDYLTHIFNMPRKFLMDGNDLIRLEMMKQLGLASDSYLSHKYNFNYSPEYRQSYQIAFQNSKFYRDYHEITLVQNANISDNLQNRDSMDMKIYGLATMYEGI